MTTATSVEPQTSGADSTAFFPIPDGGHAGADCDLAAQDCPKGQKCNPSGEGSDSVFTGLALCVPIVADPHPPGAPCSVLGDALDGTDDCALGSVCLFPDAGGVGLCHTMCEFDSDPKHDEPCTPTGTLCNRPSCGLCNWGFCDVPCDPREPGACEVGEVCIGTPEATFCILDASGDDGQAGTSCEFMNACDPGLHCADAASVAGCDDGSSGCCSPFCSTDQPNTCPGKAQGEQCVPWFMDEEPPPELANLGTCALPP